MKEKGRLKALCWNIGSVLNHLEENFLVVKKYLSNVNPDIACFQEFPKDEGLIGQIMECGQFAHYVYYTFSDSHVAQGWQMGSCVFSKYPLKLLDTLQLPTPSVRVFYEGKEEFFHRKYFLRMGLSVEGSRLELYTGHSFPFYRYGLEAKAFSSVFQGIDTWIRNSVESPYIICADFNCAEAIRYMPFVQESHFDCFEGEATRPSGRKTDSIILPRGDTVTNKWNVPTGFDHNMIAAELFLRSLH